VAPEDPAIVAAAAEFASEGATLRGYLARPSRAGTFPIVLVCHENRGLTAHIEDVTRRVAKAGYVGLAVDLLSRDGGTAKYAYDEVPGVLGKAPPERHVGDFVAGLAHARTQAAARGDRVGMTGFCFGGGVTWRVAAALPELRAAVPYYGMPIEPDKVTTIQAAVFAIYAENDERITKAIPATEAAMQQYGKTFKKLVYPGTQHAFHNDTRERYDLKAAQAAWRETLAWFAQHLA
jgi:carboxymethylenebutenolidase